MSIPAKTLLGGDACLEVPGSSTAGSTTPCGQRRPPERLRAAFMLTEQTVCGGAPLEDSGTVYHMRDSESQSIFSEDPYSPFSRVSGSEYQVWHGIWRPSSDYG